MQNDHIYPFSDSSLWLIQKRYFERRSIAAWSEAQVPHYITSNPTAACGYAKIIMGYMRDLIASTKYVPKSGSPLYIIELGAGCGRFAYHFLSQFVLLHNESNLHEFPFCYVMSDIVQNTINKWIVHPKFQPYIEKGVLDFALFNAENDNSIQLQLSNGLLQKNSLKIPPVIISNYVFDGIRQNLFFIGNKKLFKGLVSLKSGGHYISKTDYPDNDSPFDTISIEYTKEELSEAPFQRSDWNEYMEYYCRTLNNCSILFPYKALQMLERIKEFGNGMLLLSADRGTSDLSLLQEYATPAFAFHGSFSLPVNYHVIGQSFIKNNGAVWYNPQRNSGLAMICAADIPGVSLRETGIAAHEHVEEFNIDSFFLVKKVIEMINTGLDYDKMISFLTLSKWDAKIFFLFYEVCKNRLPDENFRIRNEWAEIFRKLWYRYLPIGEHQDFAFELASIAAKMRFWKLAAFFYEESLQYNGQHDVTHFNCATAYSQIAHYDKALEHFGKAININPEEKRYFNKRDILVQLRIRSENHELSEQMSTFEDEQKGITITLLGFHFAKSLYTLQQNNAIRKLTRLKTLNSIKDTKIWIKEQLDRNDKITFAVVHPEHGLIGVVALEFSGRGALFYYWIGEEYQNRGYGTKALHLLIQYAQKRGIEYLYSSVFVSNSRSIQVLKSIGFLKVESANDYDGELLEYYYRPVNELHLTDDIKHRRILDNILEKLGVTTVCTSQ